MTSSAVRIRAVPPFRNGLLKNTLQDYLEVSKDTITYNSKLVHLFAPRIPPAPSCAADTKSPQKRAEAKQNPFPPAKNSFALPRPNCISPRHTYPETSWAEPRKKNTLSFFKRNFTPAKSEMQGVFFFRGCRAERGGGGAFVHHEFLIK